VRRFGRYTLVKKLATGGMAEIWLARQSGLAGFNRFVVIKKILAHLSEEKTFVDMFLDEARTSAQLNHPNIVQIYDLGREGDSYFIAMELISGEDLAAIADRGRRTGHPLPVTLAARIVADTCKALHYAHHLRGSTGRPLEIVHRDVSPQNILVTYGGDVKVVDFGIAKAASRSEHTKTGMLKGKFSYMSPEQCRGAPLDLRSDIFALGIVLYESITGTRLFKHDSELMILDMITKRSVPPPSRVRSGIPEALDRIALRALAKSPDRRYSDALDLGRDLERFLLSMHQPSGHTDLAAHMQALFSDRIAEQQRLIELASRDDFEERFLVDPSSMSDHLSAPPVARSAAASSPASSAETRALTSAGPPSAVSAERTPRRPLARAAAGLMVLMVGGAIVASRAMRPEPPPRGTAAADRGVIAVESVPADATIYLDGAPMRLESGEFAKTPADLGPLEVGATYQLELRREGYRPHRRRLTMTHDLDGARLRPKLVAEPGRLVVRVRGDGAERARVLVDGRAVGSGPRVEHAMPGGAVARIAGELAGHRCQAEPPEVDVPPGGAATSVIRCTRPAAPKPRQREGGSAGPAAAPPAEPADSPRCRVDPDIPPGYVTIDTRPHSTIFWRDRRLGETPLAKHELPSGCVELEARGEETTKRFKVRIQPNQVAIYRVRLD